jgi:2-dehydropantoate 2-reductase
MSTPFESIAVVGAGAVGCFFGARLAQAGHHVTLIGRQRHVQAMREHGLRVQWADHVDTVAVAADTELAAVRGAELVLVAVKSTDTAATARALAPLLAADALVVSLQNGVDNAPALQRELRQTVVPCAVYVAASMAAPGVVAHHGRGELVVGALHGAADAALVARLQALAELFGSAGVPVRVADDVAGELWLKLVVNCAYNAVSALTQLPYARIAACAEVVAVQRDVVAEVVALARAEGHPLDAGQAQLAVDAIARTMPQQLSSTAQDLARGRPTEIDHLNGYVARRGAELGVAAPVNRTLHALVKLAER